MAITKGKDAIKAARLYLVRPDRVEFKARQVVVGRGGLSILAALDRGRLSIRDLCLRIWGKPEVPDQRLRMAVYRLNTDLKEIGSRSRVRFDSGDLVLV